MVLITLCKNYTNESKTRLRWFLTITSTWESARVTMTVGCKTDGSLQLTFTLGISIHGSTMFRPAATEEAPYGTRQPRIVTAYISRLGIPGTIAWATKIRSLLPITA